MRNRVAGGPVTAVLLLAGAGLGSARGEIPGDNERRAMLTVRVFNYVNAPAGDLRQAQKRARRILGDAGVGTRWLDCTPDELGFAKEAECQIAAGPLDLELKIVPRSKIPRSALPAIGFGLAQYPDERFARRASVLFFRARELAAVTGHPLELVLGHVIAHEIGHLLLGEGSHSKEGLMRARWGERDLRLASRGDLGFTDRQARRVQRAVEERAPSPFLEGN